MIRYGSVCSGIEAATVAWHSLGWVPSFFSEIEKFPREVLAHHYPDVPLHGDFTTIGANQYGSIDLLVGGTPCQSFSIAGLRKGLDDDRGNLALEFIKLAQRTRPRWVVWENVPGVLSSNKGRDFGTFLTALGEIGYGFAYRVLDAIYFGVSAKRRRVFVIGCLGDWRRAAAVLFERESFTGASEAKHKVITCGARFFMPGNRAIDREIPETLGARDYKDPQIVCTESYCRRLTPIEYERMMGFPDDYTKIPKEKRKQASQQSENSVWNYGDRLGRNDAKAKQKMCFMRRRNGSTRSGSLSSDWKSSGYSLSSVQYKTASNRGHGMGDVGLGLFGGGGVTPNGPRYKALGNSMAVPVMHWIGKRIQMVEELCQ